ncbi:hypothetical protein BH10PSE14_BH10PSE14_16650 [soil metagenome]
MRGDQRCGVDLESCRRMFGNVAALLGVADFFACAEKEPAYLIWRRSRFLDQSLQQRA